MSEVSAVPARRALAQPASSRGCALSPPQLPTTRTNRQKPSEAQDKHPGAAAQTARPTHQLLRNKGGAPLSPHSTLPTHPLREPDSGGRTHLLAASAGSVSYLSWAVSSVTCRRNRRDLHETEKRCSALTPRAPSSRLLDPSTVRFGVLAFWRFEADGQGTGRVLCVLCVLELRLTSNNKQ